MKYTDQQNEMLKLQKKLNKKIGDVCSITLMWMYNHTFNLLVYKDTELLYIYDGKNLVYKPYDLRRVILSNPTYDAVEDYLWFQFKFFLATLGTTTYDKYLKKSFRTTRRIHV